MYKVYIRGGQNFTPDGHMEHPFVSWSLHSATETEFIIQ